MGQYLYIPFLVGWTFIYQLFWFLPGLHGFDPFLCESYASCYRFKMDFSPVDGLLSYAIFTQDGYT